MDTNTRTLNTQAEKDAGLVMMRCEEAGLGSAGRDFLVENLLAASDNNLRSAAMFCKSQQEITSHEVACVNTILDRV